MTYCVFDIIQNLPGKWFISRTINGENIYSGHAFLTPADFSIPKALVFFYTESGTLSLPQGSFENFRHYTYVFFPDLMHLEIYFDHQKKRLFQNIPLSQTEHGLTGHAHYDCMPDVYDSNYAFTNNSGFCVKHVVTGPKKNMIIESVYKRKFNPQPETREPHLNTYN